MSAMDYALRILLAVGIGLTGVCNTVLFVILLHKVKEIFHKKGV